MIALPVCRHRGSADTDGRYPCASPKLHHRDGKVTGEFCATRCPKKYIDHPDTERRPRPAPSAPLRPGPGTALKRLLAEYNLTPDGCWCGQRAAEMDRNGADWSRANLQVIVGWIMDEAERRGMLADAEPQQLAFVRKFARVLVKRAIRAAR